jgi:hypothetical protein
MVQTGNMLDVVVVVVADGRLGLLPRRFANPNQMGFTSGDVIWLPDPEALAMVLLTELKRIAGGKENAE